MMDIFIFIIVILFFWLIIRALGAIFRGPRWRRRQTRKNFDYADWRISREAVRKARRNRW